MGILIILTDCAMQGTVSHDKKRWMPHFLWYFQPRRMTGMWILVPPARDGTQASCEKCRVLNTGTPGKSEAFLKTLILKIRISK